MYDRSLEPGATPEAPILIAVMGATGSGKTSFINLASHSNLQVGASLRSCTDEVQLADEFTLDGRHVVLVDTPGFDDTTKSDTDVLRMIADFLATTYENIRKMAGSKLAGVIYVHRISDKRFNGIAGRNFKIFRELCGESNLKNVILATNMWDEVPHEVGKARERELASVFLKPALDKGAQMACHHNTEQSAHDIIRRIMNNHPVILQIQRELVDESKDIANTAAGEAINVELTEEKKRHEAALDQLLEETMRMIEEKNEETRRVLEEERRSLEEVMWIVMEESEEIASQYIQELEWTEMKMQHVEAQARLDREQAEMEHKVQMVLLNDRLQEAEVEAELERLNMEREIRQLEAQLNSSGGNDSSCVIM
ncbi:P-loop containing nucleoside triphosphate hydrolase protein [Thelephora terrestris]|uniref:P-loop containing nucleoside triphosphate hydrolase protein n=1 Tax=Thelephora terrestris TaxID=56493 RepID=A0A9P6L9Q8_9AGAM|nr:P-loop containing nucleoside triphosphate hydrolase protein [Thelephora terrestris]